MPAVFYAVIYFYLYSLTRSLARSLSHSLASRRADYFTMSITAESLAALTFLRIRSEHINNVRAFSSCSTWKSHSARSPTMKNRAQSCVCVSECEATHHLRRRCAACAVSSRPTDKKPLYIARRQKKGQSMMMQQPNQITWTSAWAKSFDLINNPQERNSKKPVSALEIFLLCARWPRVEKSRVRK